MTVTRTAWMTKKSKLHRYNNGPGDIPGPYLLEENMKSIDKLLSVAKNEIGYLEKRSNSQLDSKTGNAGSSNYCIHPFRGSRGVTCLWTGAWFKHLDR